MPSNVDVTSHCAANDRVRTLSLTTAQTMSWKTDCGNARSLTLSLTAHCYRSLAHRRGIYTGRNETMADNDVDEVACVTGCGMLMSFRGNEAQTRQGMSA